MCQTHVDPKNNVTVADVAIALCPTWQSVSTLALVGIRAGSVHLRGVVRSDPQGILSEPRAEGGIIVRRHQEFSIAVDSYFIGNCLAQAIQCLRVDDHPTRMTLAKGPA